MCVGAGVVAASSVAAVLVSLSFLMVFLAAVSSPPVVALCTARANRTALWGDAADAGSATPSHTQTGVSGDSVHVGPGAVAGNGCSLSELSNRELCQAWRHSYLLSQSPGSLAGQIQVVELRRSYLDEFDRRNPRALEAWLASGARAASGPDRYLLKDAD